jgi:hypothetical protein
LRAFVTRGDFIGLVDAEMQSVRDIVRVFAHSNIAADASKYSKCTAGYSENRWGAVQTVNLD